MVTRYPAGAMPSLDSERETRHRHAVATLEALARTLGGVPSRGILQTRIGNLAVLICERPRGAALPPMFELRVFMPEISGDARLEGGAIPCLRHGYMFVGCIGGVLVAVPRALAPPTLEQIVSTLWELAGFARQRWVSCVPFTVEVQRRKRIQRIKLLLAVLGILIFLVIRWFC